MSSDRNTEILKDLIVPFTSQSQPQLEMHPGKTFMSSSEQTILPPLKNIHSRPRSGSVANNDAFVDESMKHLRNLSVEEKSEMGLLKARIDEQSRLIMILKQRGDDFIMKNMALDKMNKELNERKDELEFELKKVCHELDDLRGKFKYLGDNHETLIRIKDEYKERANVLERENKVMSEKLRMSQVMGESNDEDKKRLERSLEVAETRFMKAEESRIALDKEMHRLNGVVSEKDLELKAVVKELDDLKSKNIELDRNNRDLLEAVEQLKQTLKDSNETNEKKIEALTKEKHDLNVLCEVLKKEKIAFTETNEKLDKNYKSLSLEFNKLKEKQSKESVNEKIAEANLKYQSLEKEFEAYKKYTNTLIEREKELNNKLKFMLN